MFYLSGVQRENGGSDLIIGLTREILSTLSILEWRWKLFYTQSTEINFNFINLPCNLSCHQRNIHNISINAASPIGSRYNSKEELFIVLYNLTCAGVGVELRYRACFMVSTDFYFFTNKLLLLGIVSSLLPRCSFLFNYE